MPKRHRAAHAFRMAAQAVLRSHCACGAFSRRLQGRLGPAPALVATAPKIARTVYPMLQQRVPSHDIGAEESHPRFRERELQYFQKTTAKLGYTLALASLIRRQPELFLSTPLFGHALGRDATRGWGVLPSSSHRTTGPPRSTAPSRCAAAFAPASARRPGGATTRA